MAVHMDGRYGVAEGVVYSQPVTCAAGDYSVVEGLDVSDFSRERMEITDARARGGADGCKRGGDTREGFAGPAWETLDVWLRGQARDMIQQALEEGVTELPGRMKSERRAAVDARPGYRNGHGKPRRLAMSSGTIEVRRPPVRGIEERFESRWAASRRLGTAGQERTPRRSGVSPK